MLQLSPQHRLLLATEPADFRKGIDGLVAICRDYLLEEPFSGTVFGFCNRSGVSVKFLTYDGSGFWLAQKRFSHGKLKWWPKSALAASQVRASELQVLLAQGDPSVTPIPEDWRPLAHAAACNEMRLSV